MEVIVTDGEDERFSILCEQLDDYLERHIGKEKQEKIYNVHNDIADLQNVVILEEDDSLIGCGAFEQYDEKTVELKRIFVNSAYRHYGMGLLLVLNLENMAYKQGYRRVILETGKPLKAAQRLYLKMGFHIIENYGPYKNLKSSVCMEKHLRS